MLRKYYLLIIFKHQQKKEFIKVYKLKYNPNVDQAIKGDDTLMVDLFEENGNEKIKIYLGESKFRTTPQKNVVEDITKSLNKILCLYRTLS